MLRSEKEFLLEGFDLETFLSISWTSFSFLLNSSSSSSSFLFLFFLGPMVIIKMTKIMVRILLNGGNNTEVIKRR